MSTLEDDRQPNDHRPDVSDLGSLSGTDPPLNAYSEDERYIQMEGFEGSGFRLREVEILFYHGDWA